jgi:hypothetical protein
MDAYIPREMTRIINQSIYHSINQSIQAIPVLLQRYVLVLVVVVSNAFQSEDFEANILLGTHL